MRRLLPITILLVLLPRPAVATPGALDRSFSGDGIQTTFRGGGSAYAVALDAEDRIVVAGSTTGQRSDVAVARIRPGGAPDPAFGGDGRVRIDLGAEDRALDVATAPDGTIVVVGERVAARGRAWFVLRLRPGGGLDDTFGGDGIAGTDFGRQFEGATSVAALAGGKVLVGGSVSNGTTESWAFVRYQADGGEDHTFGGDGRVVLSLSASAEQAQDLVVRGDGMFAAGYAESRYVPTFAVVKLRSDGSRALGFGHRGVRAVNLGPGADAAFGLAVETDGKPVLAGYASSGGRADWGVTRLRAGGGLDPDFGGDGIVRTRFTPAYELASAVAIQPDGRIVVAGRARGPSGTDDLTIVRYQPGGALNLAFSGNGKALFNPFGEADTARDVLIHEGRIVVVGESMEGGVQRMVILRLQTN